jgi:uncharacterized protein (TIGR02117 family)
LGEAILRPAMSLPVLVLALLLVIAGAGHRGAVAAAGEPVWHRIYITSNDWHTRIAIAVADLPAGRIPETADFPGAAWLAFGWGDSTYYPTPKPTRRLALRAALLPTPAVIHVVPLAVPPASTDGFEVLTVRLTAAELAAVIAGIDASFDRGVAVRAPIAAPGLYARSLFYPATGTFHLFNTCNSWTARQLAAAGLPIRSRGVITADDLMDQLRDLPMVAVADG